MGLAATTELDRVRRSVDKPDTHVPQQATPLKPFIIMIVSNALSSTNIFDKALANSWTLLVNAVVMFAHQQRSWTEVLADDIFGHAYKGKRRIRGVQAPFNCAAPIIEFAGDSIGDSLVHSM